MFITWYLKNIRDAGNTIRGNCNAGVKLCTQVGDLGVFKMWINEGGMANILSIPQLEKDGWVEGQRKGANDYVNRNLSTYELRLYVRS